MRVLLLIVLIALLPLCSWAQGGQAAPAPHAAHCTEHGAIKKGAGYVHRQGLAGVKGLQNKAQHPAAAAAPDGTASERTAALAHSPLHPSDPALPPLPCATPCTFLGAAFCATSCATSCGDCALCHALPLALATGLPAPSDPPRWLRPSRCTRFDSALTAPSFKPPIA